MCQSFTGLIVQSKPMSNDSVVLTVISKEVGRTTVFAYSGRKRFTGAISVLCYSNFEVSQTRDNKQYSSYTLKNVDLIRNFFDYGREIEKHFVAYHIAKVLDCLVPSAQPMEEEAFRIAMNTLHFLTVQGSNAEHLKCVFELRFMCEIGMRPNLLGCRECGEYDKNMYFSFSGSDLICQNCIKPDERDALRISPSLLYAIRFIALSDMEKLFQHTFKDDVLKALSRFTEQYLIYKTDTDLRCVKF